MALMPRPLAPIAGNMPPTKEWLDYFRQLADAGDMAGIVKAIEKLQQQVDDLESAPANEGVVQGIGAVRSLGLLSDGLVRLDLVELEDVGGGELLNIQRDGYGRVSGTSSAEAPIDGKQYARKDGEWVEAIGGGIPEAPEDGKTYGRKDAGWEEVTGGAGPPGPPGPSSACFPTASFNGGSGDIKVGASQTLYVPFGFEITGAAIIADQAGTMQIDIRKTDFAGYPPTSLDSICGGSPPTLSSSDKIMITDFSDWDTEVESGDTLQFICTACVGITSATLVLTGTRS